MDYKSWGAEYLEEARTLKARECLRKAQLPQAKGEEVYLLEWQISMLHEMYLECMHTGRLLQERGKALETSKRKS